MNEVIVRKKDSVIVSEKEVRIVEMLADGHHCQDIADEFKLSSRTIEVYVTKLRQRFVCATHAQLVAVFIRKGIIE